jgi:hypothetical protein
MNIQSKKYGNGLFPIGLKLTKKDEMDYSSYAT